MILVNMLCVFLLKSVKCYGVFYSGGANWCEEAKDYPGLITIEEQVDSFDHCNHQYIQFKELSISEIQNLDRFD